MNEKNKQTTSALKLSMATAIFLALIKFAAGLLTHSLSILASALDSMLDVATSFVNFIAVREASKPPDEEHEYGHEKIESLAGLFQSTFIGLSGLALVIESVKRLIAGSYVKDITIGVSVMAFSILVTGLLVARLQYVAKKNASLILSTEKLHFTMDILTNGGAVVALVLVKLSSFVFWDLIVSMGIAFYIFRTSAGILRDSIDELLDRSLPVNAKEEISEIIFNHHPSVGRLHNFRSRKVRDKIFLDFHIEIRGEDDFKRAHLMTESLIHKIVERYPKADVTVHYDPEGEN